MKWTEVESPVILLTSGSEEAPLSISQVQRFIRCPRELYVSLCERPTMTRVQPTATFDLVLCSECQTIEGRRGLVFSLRRSITVWT